MPVAPNMGVLSQLGMDASSATVTEAYEFLNESLGTQREVIRQDGIRGSRQHPVERLRSGRKTPSGSVTLQPTYVELVNLLPRCIGAVSAQSGFNNYLTSDTQPASFFTVMDRVAKVFTWTGCRVDRATFSAGPGQPLQLTLDIEGLSESVGNAGTFPSLTISATAPFIFEDCVATLGGSAYQIMSWQCVVDWHLKKDRWVNSTTRTDLPSTDLTVTTNFVVPYTSDTTGLFDAGGSSSVAGIAGDINFTVGGAGAGATGTNLKFSFANLVFAQNKSPTVQGKDEITMTLSSEARRTGSTVPLTVQLDSTP